ncbi:hypothetical protein PR001_g7544 [Phytophthora rubi]|uniref:Tc1-like transposase DDE domain-containing protein n=1 Tax=Phytophthora rubi TaxID=129364 RepID=A0A6A3N7E7_9STRA|nr:hypothetical protein PR001_g7544 [Phytophthora rubi]
MGSPGKVLERRAIHVKKRDVFGFVDELSRVNWSHQNLVFLDDVAFESRGMVRKIGYSMRGEKVAIIGDFQHKPRILVLVFIGANGVVDYFDTEGAFNRVTFTNCCKEFV